VGDFVRSMRKWVHPGWTSTLLTSGVFCVTSLLHNVWCRADDVCADRCCSPAGVPRLQGRGMNDRMTHDGIHRLTEALSRQPACCSISMLL
jgi:hypothetical protein